MDSHLSLNISNIIGHFIFYKYLIVFINDRNFCLFIMINILFLFYYQYQMENTST